MDKRTKLMHILTLLVWVCCAVVIIVSQYSKIVAWVFLGLEILFILTQIVLIILEAIEWKKVEKKIKKDFREAFLKWCSEHNENMEFKEETDEYKVEISIRDIEEDKEG